MIRHSMLSLAAIGLLLVACGSSDREGSALSRPTGLAAPGMISELELILGTLEQRTMTQAATVCRASMAVAQRGSAKPGEEIASICRLALAAATGSEQTAMIAAQFASFDGELQFDLMLEAAAAGDASAYLALANQLEVQAGTSDAPYDALDANLLAAAHEAAARAVAGSISGADTVLRRLEDREFPFHGVEQGEPCISEDSMRSMTRFSTANALPAWQRPSTSSARSGKPAFARWPSTLAWKPTSRRCAHRFPVGWSRLCQGSARRCRTHLAVRCTEPVIAASRAGWSMA
jgi:hypothetical protein